MDQSVDALKKAVTNIEGSLGKIAKKQFADDSAVRCFFYRFLHSLISFFIQKASAFVKDSLQNIQTSNDIEQPARHADLIIEAVAENMEVKRNLFGRLDKVAPKSVTNLFSA